MASEEERAKIMAEYLAGQDDAADEADFDPTDEVRLAPHRNPIGFHRLNLVVVMGYLHISFIYILVSVAVFCACEGISAYIIHIHRTISPRTTHLVLFA